MLQPLKVRRVRRVNKLNLLEANKRLYVLFISMIAVISILVLSSSKSHSLEDLQMKVQYKTDQGTVETWNLKNDYEFEEEWFTKKDSVTFTVDLSDYYEEELGEEAPPFEVKARHHEKNVEDIKVKPKSPFKGVYDVSINVDKNSEGSVKDGRSEERRVGKERGCRTEREQRRI